MLPEISLEKFASVHECNIVELDEKVMVKLCTCLTLAEDYFQ
jgi:hypothetical protein